MEGPSESDEVLMERFKSGDERAFCVIFDRYTRRLVNFAYRFLHSQRAAEDIAQEVFLRVYKQKELYDDRRPFRPWFYSIASHLVSDHLRTHKRHPEMSLDGQPSHSEESRSLHDMLPAPSRLNPDEVLVTAELCQKVRLVLEALPEKQRLAVSLARFEELPYKEIAQALDISIPAVESLLFRARQTLKQALASSQDLERITGPVAATQ